MKMRTERLYYENAHLRQFTAKVLECRQENGSYAVCLDRTAFYPEGGGQPADRGELGGVHVLDVQEKAGEIMHYTDGPLDEGRTVTGLIDWERRFDLMQQHSGEHIVSGLVHSTFGCDNVGFHMGADVITIDFNCLIGEEELREIEARANRLVWDNVPVKVLYPTPDELVEIEYRSKKELEGQVRIVQIEGADTCACCGVHVESTGEIGMIRILSAVHFREGVRVEMICGGRVLCQDRMLQTQNRQISALLSAGPDQTAIYVKRLLDENFALRGRIREMEKTWITSRAAEFAGAGDTLLIEGEMEPDSVRRLADAVMQSCEGRCAVFSACPDGGYRYAIGQKDGDLRDFVRTMNQALDGRGGGKPFFVQGSVRAGEEAIRKFFS